MDSGDELDGSAVEIVRNWHVTPFSARNAVGPHFYYENHPHPDQAAAHRSIAVRSNEDVYLRSLPLTVLPRFQDDLDSLTSLLKSNQLFSKLEHPYRQFRNQRSLQDCPLRPDRPVVASGSGVAFFG